MLTMISDFRRYLKTRWFTLAYVGGFVFELLVFGANVDHIADDIRFHGPLVTVAILAAASPFYGYGMGLAAWPFYLIRHGFFEDEGRDQS